MPFYHQLITFVWLLSLALTQACRPATPETSLANKDRLVSGVDPDPRFGPEFTFTNFEILTANARLPDAEWRIRSDKSIEILAKFAAAVEQSCKTDGRCTVEKSKDPPPHDHDVFRVHYPKTPWVGFTLSLDPGVIEVQAMPMTVAQSEQAKAIFARDLFALADTLGLEPHSYNGGGSIHMDFAQAFGDDGRLFMDFFLDLTNHWILFSEQSLLGDYLTDPFITQHPRHIQEQFYNFVLKPYLANPKAYSAQQWAREITEIYKLDPREGSPIEKYQAINITKAIDPKYIQKGAATLEIRPIFPQKTYDEYIALIKLFKGRLRYLNQRIQAGLPPISFALSDFYGNQRGKLAFLAYCYFSESGQALKDLGAIVLGPRREYMKSIDEHVATNRAMAYCQSDLDAKRPPSLKASY